MPGSKGLKWNKIRSFHVYLVLMHSVLSSNHRVLSQRFAFSNHPSHLCVHLIVILAFRRIQMLLLASYFISRVTLEGKFLICICWSIPGVCQLPHCSENETAQQSSFTGNERTNNIPKELHVTTNKWKIIR